jgi:hypothetical protein
MKFQGLILKSFCSNGANQSFFTPESIFFCFEDSCFAGLFFTVKCFFDDAESEVTVLFECQV